MKIDHRLESIDENALKEKRDLLRSLLAECTKGEVGMFNAMYVSVDEIEEDKIPWALRQIETTLKKKHSGEAKRCRT